MDHSLVEDELAVLGDAEAVDGAGVTDQDFALPAQQLFAGEEQGGSVAIPGFRGRGGCRVAFWKRGGRVDRREHGRSERRQEFGIGQGQK